MEAYTRGMQSAEIELKFAVASLESLLKRLPELGFWLKTTRTFESNTLYDTPERRLREAGELLRVRQYGEKYTVTHKRHPDDERAGTIYKVRIETESEVEDGSALAEIFTRLGYGPSFRYEKYRTEYEDGVGHAVVDETPIGVFAELEGPPEWIARTMAGLDVPESACTTESYGRLFLLWKERVNSPAENLTFAEAGMAAA